MKNLEVCVQITLKPTEAGVAPERVATRVDDSHFRLVLDGGSRFDIEALEAGVLAVGFPARRAALAGALEAASRAGGREVCSKKGGAGEWSDTRATTGSMAK